MAPAYRRLTATVGDSMPLHWFKLASRPEVRLRSVKVALLVGSILTLINHGDTLFIAGNVSPLLLSKIALSYFVPFCVSTYAGVVALQEPKQP